MRLHNVNSAIPGDTSNTCSAADQELLGSSAIRIQRAWRSFFYDKRRHEISSELMDAELLNNSNLPQPMQLSTSPNTSDGMNTVFFHPGGQSGGHLPRHLIEPDPNSFSSDYSEMAEPIREHLANVQIICREDLAMGNTVGPGTSLQMSSGDSVLPIGLEREIDETDEAFHRRVRVTNYLSLAQEFAALKKVDAKALPFDLYNGSNLSHETVCSFSSSDEEYVDDSDLEEMNESELVEAEKMESVHQATSTVSEKCISPSPSRQSSIATSGSSMTKACIPDVVPNWNRPKPQHDSNQMSDSHYLNSQIPTVHTTVSSSQPQCGFVKSPARGTGNTTAIVPPIETSIVGNTVIEMLEEFDVYTIETALPHVEWERLERKLIRSSAQEEKKRQSMYAGDRDEIRRRLAMSAFEDDEAVGASARTRHGQHAPQPGLSTHNRMLHSATSLQVCYLNESLDTEREQDLVIRNRSNCKPDIIPKSISEASTLSQYRSKINSKNVDPHEDFFAKQAMLKAEAKLALAQVRPMAHMQLQVEKQSRKKSPLSEIVVGIPGFFDGKMRSLSRHLLKRMNFAQLQVVVNDLHAQIEALNADLMQQLVDRDDLHMAQDSMLVDIDDLTRRAQEFAAKVNKQAAGPDIK